MQLHKKMHFVLSMLGQKLLPLLSLILSLSYSDRLVKGSETNEFNLCTLRHCEDCAGGEFLKCSNSASSNLCGDLCGCCHSCIKFRDFEESCGSQLAVRSSENFHDSRSRVRILATTSCRKGLICKNFACEGLEKVNFEPNDEEFLEIRTNIITIENSNELKDNIDKIGNDKAEFERGIKLPTLTEIPSTREILSPSQSRENKIFDHIFQQDVKKVKNILLNPSGHLINLLLAGKEFQLIYGHEPLKDLSLLIDSIDKNNSNSIINEFEADILYERFNEVVQFVNSKRKTSNDERLNNSSSTSSKIENYLKNRNKKKTTTIRDSGVITVLRNFVLIPGTEENSRLRGPARKLRKKRELDEVEKFKDEVKVEDSKNGRQIDEKIDKGYREVSIYNLATKIPRPIEDFDNWMVARKIEINPDEISRIGKIVDGDGIESEINIHVTGMPRIMNFSPAVYEEKNENFANGKFPEKYVNYENLEKFVSDANTEVAEFSTMKDPHKLANLTSEISQSKKNIEIERADNTTENHWTHNEKSKFFNNYEFIYPENPETLESDYFRDFDIFVNETVDEFKSQLDRIETKTMFIESVLFDMMGKMDERWKNIENGVTKIQRVEIDEERRNEFEKKSVTQDENKIEHIPREKSTSPSPLINYPENKDFISNGSKLGQFFPTESNRHRKTFTIRPNLPEIPKNIGSQRRRLNRSRENKSDQPEVTSDSDKLTRRRENSDGQNQESQPRRSSSINFLKGLPKVLGQRKFPILLSNSDSNREHFYNNQRDDGRLFSHGQTNFAITSDSEQHQRSVWPLNLILNRALSADRSSRKSQESIRQGGKNLELKKPIEESVILLETQIPKSISQPRDSMIFGDRMGESSMRFMTHYGDDDDSNWGDEKASLNLFVVDQENSQFGMASPRSKLPKTLVLPMENIRMETNHQASQDMDENYQIFPAYLDYSERLENNKKGDEIVESETIESTVNPVRNKQINSRSIDRKKRSLNDFSESQNFNDTNKILQSIKTINSNVNDSSLISTSMKSENLQYSSRNAENDEKNVKKIENSQEAITNVKNKLEKRSKRSVQMVDWLRAAQEYHERLRQVKNAAMKTWLASKEELDDANLTNVKLFTREIPTYLERYRQNFQDVNSNLRGEKSEEIHENFSNFQDSIPDTSQVLTDILAEQTLLEKNNSQLEMDASNDDQLKFSEISNSDGPKKFTIITNGDSTMRIEEIFDNEDEVTWLDDQLVQGSTGSEVHEIPMTLSDSDYFDHMYESFDADDEEFDYEDSNLKMLRWLDNVDVIDSSSVEIPEKNYDEIKKEFKEEHFDTEEDEDPSSRFKRDSPLFLFKVKGNPQYDVLVWPSNWKDLINRHLRLNNTRDSSQRTTKKTHSRLTKIDPKFESSTTMTTHIDESKTKKNDEISSSSEIIVREEKSPQDSTVDLDVARKLQKSFEHRTRQNRRKNGVYRGNI